MNLQSNDFVLFGLPERFEQDRATLDQRWKDLQRQVHPDRFAADAATAQRVAMQWSVRINEAYQRLKNPLKRAAYLCELRGAPIQAENNTAMPSAFLMQQMEWREALDEATSAADLQALKAQTQSSARELTAQLAQALDTDGDATRAAQSVRALMFVERFASEVEDRLDQLGQ
ncbi:Fe-S protein assembly co-chaperone HscB [Hydrogenophaga atypica]|uniref:Co-chaperone protein HscB homolog n=1 Tax=Hydrogenophaga atypica TaxID=249409 RepID=A0ABW2QHX7_9BURK